MQGKPVLETQPIMIENLWIVGKLFFIKTHREKKTREKKNLALYTGVEDLVPCSGV